jgi:hypothetical protein
MKTILLVVALLLSIQAGAETPKPEPGPLAKTVNDGASNIENTLIPAVEAMPEEKFAFVPSTGTFKGVRTFAQQVKHVAVCNFLLGGGILGEKPPVDPGQEGNGPATIMSKAGILQFLKDSYVYVHKAILTITDQNAAAPIKGPWGEDTTRLRLASIIEAHGFDHYGQMVVSLRMNGILPPPRRK